MTEPHNRLVRLLFLTLVVVICVSVAPLNARAQSRGSLPIPPGAPAAVIKSMAADQTTAAVATVSRNGNSTPAFQGFLLYLGDVIETENAKVTVVFLDDPYAERDDEVIIDANSRVGISSTYSWWGTVWAKVKDVFTSKTTYAQAGATGTEYEFSVFNPNHSLTDPVSATLVVLEGSMEVSKKPSNFVSQNLQRPLEPLEFRLAPIFQFANFVTPSLGQEGIGRTEDVLVGMITSFQPTYHLHNDCKQPHRIEFRTTDEAKWLRIEGDRVVEIGGGKNLDAKLTLMVDATALTLGRYEADIYAVCLDCNNERNCPEQQIHFKFRVNVMSRLTQTPTPTPIIPSSPTPTVSASPSLPVNQTFNVGRLQEADVTRGRDKASAAPTPQVLKVLSWTDEVLLRNQPSYAAHNLIPHFATIQDRSQTFAPARERAILANDGGSYAILGNVYSDWGQGAWASFAYLKSSTGITAQQALPGSTSLDLAEAYRMAGRLDDAIAISKSSAGDTSPKAQNLFGNLAMEQARIAFDKGDLQQASARAEEAKKLYALVAQAQAPISRGASANTLQANLAEANILSGEIALKTRLTDARARFNEAVRTLVAMQQSQSIYPFPVTDLGVAYRGLGDAAVLSGDLQAATDAYAKAKQQHQQATTAHPDFAEAYFDLGDLYDDRGDRENAKANYRLSIQARPEQPAAYYPLAMLIKDENPALAAALAQVYLKLERPVFLRGNKGENARKLVNGSPVDRPPRIGEQIGGVPNLIGKKQSDAQNLISSAGYKVGTIETRSGPGAADLVLEQRPVAGSKAPRGSAVDLVLSAGPDNGVPVPNVLNLSQTEARTAIEKAGLKVGNVTKRNESTRAEGTVLEQKPNAGASAPRGSAIEIVVASVEPPVVPNVVGMSQTQATTAIENAGLKVRKIQTRSENAPKNTVIKQSPNAGKTVKGGSNVDLVVSEGVDVPGVINNSRDKATREIIKRGLTVGKIEEQGSCKVGDVIAQNPAPHAKADPGTPVDLVIGSLGEDPVSVPNLIGRSRDEAIAAIRDKELTVGSVQPEESDAPEGTVIKQSPRAETQFARNCRFKIDLTVAIPLTVPDVRGLSERAARFQISLKGFSPSVEYRETSDKRDGIVLEQDPQPGTRAARGSAVRLVVSKVPTVPVPNVVTMLLPNAKATLENAQLNLGQVTYEKSNARPAPVGRTFGFPVDTCKVTRQDPVGGRQVPRGTAVHLWVIEWLDGNHKQLDCRNYSNNGN